MSSIFRKDKIGAVTNNATQVFLAPSILTIGGRQYETTSSISLSPALAVSTFYYVYAVASAGVVSLAVDESAEAPVGYNAYRKVGAFYTDGSGDIHKSYTYNETNKTEITAIIDGGSPFSILETNSSELGAWITTTNPSTGRYLFNYTNLNLTVAPSLVVSSVYVAYGPRTGFIGTVVTSTSAEVYLSGDNVGNVVNVNSLNIQIAKQGIDSIQPDWSL